MKNMTWTDVIQISIVMLIGAGVIAAAAAQIEVSTSVGRAGLILWLIACPLLYIKIKLSGEEKNVA